MSRETAPRIPEASTCLGHEGSALDALQQVFANDAKMRVTQESDGKIRMVETDVPKDFLDVKIHHLSFPSDYTTGNPQKKMALYAIIHTPEVGHFIMDHNIRPRRVASACLAMIRSR